MRFVRNENKGFTEMYKGDRLYGLSFTIEDLWKRRVYVTYLNNSNKSLNRNRRKKVS